MPSSEVNPEYEVHSWWETKSLGQPTIQTRQLAKESLNKPTTMMTLKWALLSVLPCVVSSFSHQGLKRYVTGLKSTIDTATVPPSTEDLVQLKSELVKVCCRSPKAALSEVCDLVQGLESTAEMVSAIASWRHIP